MTRAALLLLALAAAGCDPVDRINRPLPAHLSLLALDGRRLERESLAGRPWVVSLWVPGDEQAARAEKLMRELGHTVSVVGNGA